MLCGQIWPDMVKNVRFRHVEKSPEGPLTYYIRQFLDWIVYTYLDILKRPDFYNNEIMVPELTSKILCWMLCGLFMDCRVF